MSSVRPSIELALVGLLRNRPMHGYALYGVLCDKTGIGLAWSVKRSQLYAILASLEARGLISGEIPGDSDAASGPPRKVFSVTAEGESAFLEWAVLPIPRGSMRVEFHAKLHFALAESDSAALALVAAQRELCSDWIADMRSRESLSKGKPSADANKTGDELIYEYRIGQLEATLVWLDRCAKTIEQRRDAP